MKQRLLAGWTARRVIFLAGGLYMIILSVMDKDWGWILPGTYFAAMGLFSFGCASGNCAGETCYRKNK